MRPRSSPSAAADASGSTLVQSRALSCRSRAGGAGSRRGRRRSPASSRRTSRAAGRTAVARVERRPLPEQAVELEVGQDRPQHERPDVEPAESSCSETANCVPRRVREDLVEQARDASRVGVSPKAKFSSVGTSSGQASSSHGRRLAVAAGAADLLRVRLEALRQVVVVDVADVGLVDPHAEGDRRDDDVARPRPCHHSCTATRSSALMPAW